MVFSTGYNRRKTDMHKRSFKPLTLTRTGYIKPKSTTSKSSDRTENKTKINHKNKNEIPKKKLHCMQESTKFIPQVQESLVISGVRDPKNQLSSLVSNAKKNMDSLNERNNRIKNAKKQSRSRYGW
ncbi:similar to hypothetical protein KAFR_0D03660 [Kazachstania africana CBS 2517] [Maudiozyma barnettii]|uniref:Uncharacterized protein n=1 Tax=Maudiozyma barnettii TaxID=61262 RepID=A0A8H2VFG8_9SACH|nr:similar to hypothetical protein KAFR_0D03660 [Kazachstania africana CBS 2517] [Kazachstania barnettii]CAB4254644.1 similar to hypothetical protein KAFR_0D03660 [Kazachstania africana CBS 2517] [Kazachstania barnettii]CAD1782686.1 similar to hypothetical protein KAFR_0D03660 [Kazachstania africana CBS 2517] [Kazachstania barnettii]